MCRKSDHSRDFENVSVQEMPIFPLPLSLLQEGVSFFTGDSEIEWIIPYSQCNKEVIPLSNGPETDINDIIV